MKEYERNKASNDNIALDEFFVELEWSALSRKIKEHSMKHFVVHSGEY